MFRQNLNCRVWSKARSIIYCFLVKSPSHLCKSANHEHGFGGCEEVLEMRTYVIYVNWQRLYLQLMMLTLTLAIVRNFTQPRSQGWEAWVPQSTMDPTIPASTWISIPTSVRAVLSRLIWNLLKLHPPSLQLTTVAAAPVMTNVVLLANAPFVQPWLSQQECVRWRRRLRGWASSLSIQKAPSHVESRLMKLRLIRLDESFVKFQVEGPAAKWSACGLHDPLYRAKCLDIEFVGC